jgi:histidine triad (HIT) family protein
MAAGAAAAAMVAESPATIAVMALHPFRPGHVLVIPRAHAPSVWALAAGDYDEVMREARRVAAALQAAQAPPRVGLMVSGFEVEHAHVHVVPLHERHDLTSQRALDGPLARAEPGALAAEAARLRAALDGAAPASRS